MQAGFSAVVLKTHGIEASELLLNTVGRPVHRMTDWRCLDLWKPIPPKSSDPRLGRKRGRKSPHYTLTLISPGVILSYFRGEKYIEYVNKTKDLLKGDALVIASIVAFTEKGWDEQCHLIKRTGADMVELNFGCPYVAVAKLNPRFTVTFRQFGGKFFIKPLKIDSTPPRNPCIYRHLIMRHALTMKRQLFEPRRRLCKSFLEVLCE